MKIVFKSKQYAIYEIPDDVEEVHQYKIYINENVKAKKPQFKIDRDCYSMFENGVEVAHEMAKEVHEEDSRIVLQITHAGLFGIRVRRNL